MLLLAACVMLMSQLEGVRRTARQDAIDALAEALAERAEAARAAVLRELLPLKTMKVAEERLGAQFFTPEGKGGRFTVTMSVREARSLVAISGPIGKLNGTGPTMRLLCAMGIVQRQLLRDGGRPGASRLAVLMVLKVALQDCMAECGPLPSVARLKRGPKPGKRPKPVLVVPDR